MAHSAEHSHDNTKRIWTVFWILLVITVVEIAWGMKVSHILPKWINAIFFLSLTFVKAGYIVAEFMHLKHELKNMILTILIPLLLFIWFVIAFCWDGGSWLTLKKEYKGNNTEKVAAPQGNHGGGH